MSIWDDERAVRSQAAAWQAVFAALQQAFPGWSKGGENECSMDCAVRTIKESAEEIKRLSQVRYWNTAAQIRTSQLCELLHCEPDEIVTRVKNLVTPDKTTVVRDPPGDVDITVNGVRIIVRSA
jgi:hypothetical protein